MPIATESTSSAAETQVAVTPWWGAWSAFLIVGCFFLFQSIGIFVVQFLVTLNIGFEAGLSGTTDASGTEHVQIWLLPLSLLLGTVAAVMVSLQVAISRAQPSMDSDWLWDLIGRSYDLRCLWRFVLSGVGLGFGFFALTEYGVVPPDDLPQPLFDAMISSPPLVKVGWLVIFVGLFPVVEEVLFRGFLFAGLSQSWGPSLAGIVTTVLFVAVHMPKVLEYWPALLAVSLIGSLTVLIRIRTGSLAPGIALHSAYNGTLVCTALLSESSSPSS